MRFLRRYLSSIVTAAAPLVVGMAFLCSSVQIGSACPFCQAAQATLRQEMEPIDVVLLCETTGRKDAVGERYQMKVVKVLKGEKYFKEGSTFFAPYYGNVLPGSQFVCSGIDPADFQWSCMRVNERVRDYYMAICKLPSDPEKQLRFYLPYLYDSEEMLRRDAYDEFANAPYEIVEKLKDAYDRKKLIDSINDPKRSKAANGCSLRCWEFAVTRMIFRCLKSFSKGTRKAFEPALMRSSPAT